MSGRESHQADDSLRGGIAPTASGSEHARPVFFTLDELVNLPSVKLRALAQERYHAAPADSVDAVEKALRFHDVEDAVDIATQAVLRALGNPTNKGYAS